MNDSTVSSKDVPEQGGGAGAAEEGPVPLVAVGARRWLLLTHHLPPEPAYFRVKVRRRLERIGAVALKNSVYALPPSEETREDMEWLAQEIERNGGEASLCVAGFLDDVTDERLLAGFGEARAADYAEITGAAHELAARWEEERVKETGGFARAADVRRLRERLARASAIDFFHAPGRDAAERALADLEALLRGEAKPADSSDPADRPSGRTWVTRAGIKVDRIASAWLIRRFIDPGATFRFVDPDAHEPAAGELRFDMYGGEFTHEGEACTFETLLARFVPDDSVLATLGEIVHDIDCKDDKFEHPEAQGVAAMIDGLIRTCDRDAERLDRGSTLFDGLYAHFQTRAS